MAITLYGSYTSPYVRRVRMFMKDQNYEMKLINYLEKNDAALLAKINPVNKIPVLQVDEQIIWDSRSIYTYFERKLGWPELSFEQLNYLTAVEGALDTVISLFLLKRGGLDIYQKNSYLTRQQERTSLVLDHLGPWVEKKALEKFDFPAQSLYCFLDWASFRQMIDFENIPFSQAFKKFMNHYADLPEVKSTQIPAGV